MARASLNNIRDRLRRMIGDIAETVWLDDELDEILDQNRLDFYRKPLTIIRSGYGDALTYRVYQSSFGNLEEYDATDTTIFNLYDSEGNNPTIGGGTPDVTVDYITGRLLFTEDQQGKNYYLDGRTYNLDGAAAHCWREAAATKAELYNFSEDGQQYSRSDWFKHCLEMAKHFESQARGWLRGARFAEAIRH